ncbi:alpha-N-acetylneuraminide alpha-2,8-sialyltransferase isoform X2 [Mauremys reevesii]|uniref:alpha-N-acetylneuraminide alpha-2,8-sialyltransferase isoform X2 n=1 Tax=Mauremys reevesii TaxID=260615 RepID=UPI00193F1ABD|nr:alpha-N-acetylneuraminide alpha-2,8-sialyltransferase isoform X2 [Mauremys reevesii]
MILFSVGERSTSSIGKYTMIHVANGGKEKRAILEEQPAVGRWEKNFKIPLRYGPSCLYCLLLSSSDKTKNANQKQEKLSSRDSCSDSKEREQMNELKQLEDCCDPGQLFAMTKQNSPLGKNLWFDGEFLHSVTIDNATYSLFPQATPFQLPLKKCSVVGNGGILKKSGCGRQIDQADFVMRCNLPPLSSEYSKDVGSKTQLVTANPSIIEKRFQNLLWSRKTFVDSVKVYNHSYIYMPAFSMKTGTEPSLRVYYTLEDFGANQTVLFANPNFLRDIGKFWKSRGIHAKRLSTGLFLVSAALGLCEEVTIYGFWPFSVDLHGRFISHHYYDNVLPDSGFHAMPEEFLQLWFLHKNGVLRMQLEQCEAPLLQSSA